MPYSNESDENQIKRICFVCVGEKYLSDEIEQTGEMGECSYCCETEISWTIHKLAEQIEVAFEQHYTRTSDQPDSWQERMLADKESTYDWDREGTPVLEAIEYAAEIPQEAAVDALELLEDKHADFESAIMGEETEFSFESYYEEKGFSDQTWQAEWHYFEQSLRSEARFFSRTAAAHLASIFGDIDRLKTRDGRFLVVDAGPQFALEHLYRARVFQSDEKLKIALCRPDLHLGSPPARLATSGRMNARGISVFYGATDASVAIAEIRPPVGSKAAVARFSIIRPLRLLDLTSLEDAYDEGSIFDPSLKKRLEKVSFLRTLGRRITRPVMPDDQDFDYLATQAIADFLATENEPRLDGIIFQSAQSQDGRNVVLFHKAARVKTIKFPEGTEIKARTGYETEDGWELEYSVNEKVLPQITSKTSKPKDFFEHTLLYSTVCHWENDLRDMTLQINLESVEVHHVDWVQVQSTSHKVDRHRSETQDWDFN